MRELLNATPVAVLVFVAVMAPLWLFLWWTDRRHRRRWELQAQLREMERAIREEAMSDEAREWWRQHHERHAAIKREARRRLGLPDEESPAC